MRRRKTTTRTSRKRKQGSRYQRDSGLRGSASQETTIVKRTDAPEFPTEARKPLLDLLAERLVFSDLFKARMASLTPAEQLAEAERMDRPPESAAEREFFGEIVWTNVKLRFMGTLSAEELRLWEDPKDSPPYVRLRKAFDAFLLEQFRYFGPALLLSYDALKIIFGWRERDPHKMKLLFGELELNSRKARGEAGARFPIGMEAAALKSQAINELRVLFPKARAEFSTKNRTVREIADWVEREIKGHPIVFRCLGRNLPQLKSFLLNAQQENLALGIVSGRTRAPSFIDAWVAEAYGYSIERARQEMSKSRQ